MPRTFSKQVGEPTCVSPEPSFVEASNSHEWKSVDERESKVTRCQVDDVHV